MVLNEHRGKADKYLLPLAERFRGSDPNTLTWISLVFALLAGVCFYFAESVHYDSSILADGRVYFLFVAALFLLFFNGVFDALDGKVARITGRSTTRGDYLDHVVDRFADMFILGGIALSPYCDARLGMFALVTVLLVSYMGTQAQAMGCGRDYGGMLGRADRIMILFFAPFAQFISYWFIDDPHARLPYIHMNILELVLLAFAVLGIVTIVQRFGKAWQELGEKDERAAAGRRGRSTKK